MRTYVYESSGDEDEEYKVKYIMEAMAAGDDEGTALAATTKEQTKPTMTILRLNEPSTNIPTTLMDDVEN